MTELDQIKQHTGTAENNCTCDTCKHMCHVQPCMGTPADILRLFNNGHINKLVPTEWGVGHAVGIMPVVKNMIQARFDLEKGHCVFLTDDNLCSLHADGLKPTEGKLATHANKVYYTREEAHKALTITVAKTWLNPSNFKTLDALYKGFVKYFTNQKPIHNEKSIFYLPARAGNDQLQQRTSDVPQGGPSYTEAL
jgi:hypothetical protein